MKDETKMVSDAQDGAPWLEELSDEDLELVAGGDEKNYQGQNQIQDQPGQSQG